MAFTKPITEQANRIVETHFSGPQRRTVNVYGGIGIGKSTVLASLVDVLRARGELPIFVSPTAAQLDTASEALVQIFDGLDSYDLLNGVLDQVKDPALPFDDKVKIAQRIVAKHKSEVVLLCDEPNEWAIRSKQDPLYYVGENKQSLAMAEKIRSDFDCAKVIAERSWNVAPDIGWTKLADASNVQSSDDITVFSDELSEIRAINRSLESERSFFRLRLLAALLAVGDNSFLEIWPDDNSLAIHFLDVVKYKRPVMQLLKLVGKIALVRGEISDAMLAHLGINSGLLELDKRIVRHAFLSPIGANVYSMHPVLRSVIANACLLTQQETMRAHAQIAEFQVDYLNLLRKQNKAALLAEYRGYDQCAKAGFASIERVSHFFVSQLHVWGRCLSRDLKQFSEAADVFDIAIHEDSRDDYGHHYKAYNLDYIAKDEPSSELHYKMAVRLNPVHPWYWSRWINFLITTGRMKEAREEWVTAGNALSAPDNCDDETFSHLHFWVAQLLIHRAQLDFAKQMLDEVPSRVRRNRSQFIELDQLLDSLLIARDERAVFPTYVVPDEYWSAYPHLNQPLQWNGRSLTSFYSARVEEWREKDVDLVVGKKEDCDIRYGRVTFTQEEFKEALEGFDWDNHKEIRFVELCFYGGENKLRIDVYPAQSPNRSSLPNLDPPNPNRYLEGWNPRS